MAKKKHEIDFKYNLKKYWSFMKEYKALIFFLLLVMTIVQLTYVADKFLFKIIIDRGTEFVAGTLGRSPFVTILLTIAAVYISIIIIKVICKWLQLHFLNLLEVNTITDLKRKFFNHILHLSYNFHTTHKTGSLISRLVRGGRAMEGMTDVLIFNMLPLVFQLVIVGGSLLYFDWVPALVLIITAAVFIIYSLFVQQAQKQANVDANDAEDREKARVSDYMINIDPIKFFGKEGNIKKRFAMVSNVSKFAMLKHWTYFKWMDSIHSLILGTGTFFLIYFPLVRFLDGEITLGTLTFVYTIYGNLIYPLFSFVHGLRHAYRAMADFEALFKYGKIENDIKDLPNAPNLKIKEGKIEFNKISFSYNRRRLLQNFNLTIPTNKKVAFVGHSGCGKTTLVRLLYRMYDVQKGEILVDGKNIKSFKQESLRSELSMVPQECILFDDTIYNNIAFSRPSATRREVFKAIKFAQLDKFVKVLPKKDKTIVGERGVKLSGGEKQRVSIARAILADKKVLVLDEATSSLDSKTEHEIQNDLQRLMEGRTSIIIAHRLSTIMKADLIVVMEKGKIVQMGNHWDLIKQKGEYKKLWNLQKGGYVK